MSEFHRVEDERITSEIKIAIDSLKNAPEGPELHYFVQTIVSSVWNVIPTDRDWYSESRRSESLAIMASNPHHFELTQIRLGNLRNFIGKFLQTAFEANILFNDAAWLSFTVRFLIDMLEFPSLEWMASFLASLFVGKFYNIYLCLDSEYNTKMKIIQSGNIREINLEQLKENVALLKKDREYLQSDLISFMSIISHSLSYKQPNNLLPNQLKIIFKDLPSSIIFENRSFYFDFYLQCLQSQNITILKSVLNSIIKIITSEDESNENKILILNSMCDDETIGINLFCLATHTSAIITAKTLSILLKIYGLNLKIISWGADEYCTIFLNIFHKSREIRNLTGQFMLTVLKDRSDSDILKNILDFYLQYKSSPLDMPVLIESLWQFDYMKDIDNIKELFLDPNSEQYGEVGEIRNAAVAFFCVAVLEQLKKACDDERILKCMKSLPQLFAVLQNNPIHFSILSKIFSIFDAKFYEPTSIGDQTYADELIESFGQALLNGTDIQCFEIATVVFTNLATMRYYKPKQKFTGIVETIYEEFKNKFFLWVSKEDLQIDDDLLDNLMVTSNKISCFFNYPALLTVRQDEEIHNMMLLALFEKKVFDNSPPKCKLLESIFLEIFSNTLIVRLERAVESGSVNKECKKEFQRTITYAKQLLDDHRNSIFISEKAVKVITDMFFVLQPSCLLSKNKSLRILAAPLDTNIYRLVWDICTDILCKDERLDSKTEGTKQRILTHLTEFQRNYSGLSASTIEYKHFAELLLKCKYTIKVDNLILAAAEYKTPFDGKHRRISALLSATFIKWADENEDSKAAVKRLIYLFKTKLDDWQELFAMIILRTIMSLTKRLAVLRPDRNRMLALNLLQSFVYPNEILKQKVQRALNAIASDLQRNERKIVEHFQSYF